MATNGMRNNGQLDTAWVAGGLVFAALLVLLALNLAGLNVNVGVRVG
jgi:hypothetical protein